jgi:hypothetical protein
VTARKLTAADLEPLVEAAEGSDPAAAAAARSKLISLAEDRSAFADDDVWAWIELAMASWGDPKG